MSASVVRSRHGERARYVARCHCERCTAANAEYQGAWRKGTPPPMNQPDLDWQVDAACRDDETNRWYVEERSAYGAGEPRVPEELGAVCETCPVREACLSHALQFEDHGVWANTTPERRRRLRKAAGIRLQVWDGFLGARADSSVPLPPDPFEEAV
jgi:WhiB family redox-sensing transcriptional regulator